MYTHCAVLVAAYWPYCPDFEIGILMFESVEGTVVLPPGVDFAVAAADLEQLAATD